MTHNEEHAIRALTETRTVGLNGDQCRNWFRILLAHVVEQRQRIADLEALTRSEADRIAAQSELLTKRAMA